MLAIMLMDLLLKFVYCLTKMMCIVAAVVAGMVVVCRSAALCKAQRHLQTWVWIASLLTCKQVFQFWVPLWLMQGEGCIHFFLPLQIFVGSTRYPDALFGGSDYTWGPSDSFQHILLAIASRAMPQHEAGRLHSLITKNIKPPIQQLSLVLSTLLALMFRTLRKYILQCRVLIWLLYWCRGHYLIVSIACMFE